MISRPLAISLAAALTLAAAQGAGAQVTGTRPVPTEIQRPTELSIVRPIATVSFVPYTMYGSLGGVNVVAQLGWVTLSNLSRVLMDKTANSTIRLYTNPNQPLPAGAYAVSFAAPWVGAGGATASIVTGMGTGTLTVVGTCQLTQQTSYAQGAPVQHCGSNIVEVPDGRLNLTLRIDGGQMDVSNITVNRYR